MTDKEGSEADSGNESKPTRDANGRFSGGPSANPRGRPPKAKETELEMLRRVINGPMTIHENGVKRKVSADEAVRLVVRKRALSGDPRAQIQWDRYRAELDRLEREHKAQEVEDTGYTEELRRRLEIYAARHVAEQAAIRKRDEEAADKIGRNVERADDKEP